MHSFFKKANYLHNHSIQLHNLGIWYLEWVWDEELFLLVLFYTPSQANRACPDVINWSISANNTAQTHHYTQKAFPFFSSKQSRQIQDFRASVQNRAYHRCSDSKQLVMRWVIFLVLWWTLGRGRKKWFIAQHVETLTIVEKSYDHMETESLT